MVGEFFALLALLALSATKFLFAPLAYLSSGFTVWQTVFYNSLGGILGALIFFFLGKYIFNWWERFFPVKRNKKTFTPVNRAIVRLKNKFGVVGLSLLIPLISVPISAFLAAKYFRYDTKAIPAYIFSSIFWSLVLTFFSQPIKALISDLF